MPNRWVLPNTRAEDAQSLAAALGIGTLAAKVLVRRGLGDPAAARRFLKPSFDEFHDPFLLRDMSAAVDRLVRAIRSGEKILIYGDYDVDGTSSVVVLVKAIE